MSIQQHKRTKKIHKNIKLNIKRRTIIVDDQLVFHKSVPIPSWVELSIIDVCNRSFESHIFQIFSEFIN